MNNIKIVVNPKDGSGGAVGLRNKRIREKILTRLFGETENVMVLIPGKNVETLHIKEEIGGTQDEALRS